MKKMEIIGYAIIIAIITVWLSLPAKNQETKKRIKDSSNNRERETYIPSGI